MRLAAIFGHSWSSRHTSREAWEITKDEWANALSGINVDNIRKSLDQLREENIEFPPSLPCFLKRCKSFDKKFFESEIKNKSFSEKEKSNIHEIMKKSKELSFSNQKDHPEWEKKKYTIGSKSFCMYHFSQRKSYLIKLDELSALNLSNEDKYDRCRFLREETSKKMYPHLFEGNRDE